MASFLKIFTFDSYHSASEFQQIGSDVHLDWLEIILINPHHGESKMNMFCFCFFFTAWVIMNDSLISKNNLGATSMGGVILKWGRFLRATCPDSLMNVYWIIMNTVWNSILQNVFSANQTKKKTIILPIFNVHFQRHSINLWFFCELNNVRGSSGQFRIKYPNIFEKLIIAIFEVLWVW